MRYRPEYQDPRLKAAGLFYLSASIRFYVDKLYLQMYCGGIKWYISEGMWIKVENAFIA